MKSIQCDEIAFRCQLQKPMNASRGTFNDSVVAPSDTVECLCDILFDILETVSMELAERWCRPVFGKACFDIYRFRIGANVPKFKYLGHTWYK